MKTFEVDSYGSLARRSALADALEIQAAIGHQVTVEALADRIRDTNWTKDLGDRLVYGDQVGVPTSELAEQELDFATEQDAARQSAEAVFDVLRLRQDLLDERYPFRLQGPRLTLTGGQDGEYFLLLCVTLAHAYKLELEHSVTDVFEQHVEKRLRRAGIATALIGTARAADASASGARFETVVQAACDSLSLAVSLENDVYSRWANDERTDTISNLFPHDPRIGGVQLIGQVTCGGSDSWQRKATSPTPAQWRKWLGTYTEPNSFLAVPHHVVGPSRRRVLQTKADLVDRVRLTFTAAVEMTDAERGVRDAVIAAPWDRW